MFELILKCKDPCLPDALLNASDHIGIYHKNSENSFHHIKPLNA